MGFFSWIILGLLAGMMANVIMLARVYRYFYTTNIDKKMHLGLLTLWFSCSAPLDVWYETQEVRLVKFL
jgi:hypothetical protein